MGTKYLLQVENSNVAPENVSVKRVGKDLQVFLNGSEEPELVIQDYFAEGMDTQLYGAAEDGQLYSYVRADGESFLLADGELEPIVLGTSSLGTAPLAYAGMESAGSALLWPLLAGAGVVGVATATRSSNSNHHGLLLQAPAKLAISNITNDNDPLHPSNIAHNSATNDPTPVVSGSGATPGDIIHVLDNGNEIGSTTANADGSWSFVPDLPLDDGTHDIVVIDEDPATHEKSEPSDPYTIIVDTNAPDVPAISDVINERDVGGPIHVEPNGLTSGSTPVISGVGAEPGDTIHVMDNGSEIGTAVVEPDGSWSFTPGSPLADGAHELSVSAEDPAGNRSDPSAPYPITIDTSPLIADLWFDALAGDDIINAVEATSVVVVSGGSSGARAGDMVIVTFGELSYSSTVAADGRWSVNVPGSELVANEPPRIYCTLFATDAAGNEVSVSTFHMYTVDLIPPDAPTIDSVANNNDPEHPIDVAKDGSTNDNTPVLSGEAEPGSTVHVYDNGVELGTAVADKDGTWSYEVPVDKALADGEHDFTVIAVDAGGNPSVPSNDYPVVIDTDPPTPDTSHLTIDAVAGNDLVNQDKAAQQQTISGHASGEFQAGDIVRFELNDTSYSAAVDASGDWSVQVAGSDLAAETNIHATLEAHDLAGNVGMIDADRPYTVNLTPPLASLSIDIVAGDDIVNIAEAAVDQAITGGSTGGRAGDVVKVIVNHITYSGTIDANGDWSISVPGAELVADELHIINATLDATNVAGNHATVTAEHAYSVDIIPPVATLTINVVAGDDIVNIAESKVNQTISGKVVGEFKAGDLVSFTLNGTDYSATVRATGDWNVSVAGSDLAAETNIHATLVAHDTAGNSASIVADHAYAVDLIAPEATLTINVVAGDDILNLAESQTSQTISGKVAGEFLPNDLVTFTLNGTTYSAAVNASGDWSVPVAGSDLAKESNIHATLIAHDVAGNSSTVVADHGYVVKLIPEDVTLTIDTVAGDDIVNLAESQTSQTISGKAIGSFTAGDLVTFTLDGTDYSAQVNASGAWSVQVPGSALAGDPGLNIHATLVAHDDVGNVNTVTADHAYRVDTVPPVATLTINVVAGDDIVNLAESKVNQTISGKVGGEFSVGDLVSFTLNGTDYSAAVRATGDWSVSVAGSDLAAETNIHATLVAHDTAGNSANVVADHGYAVDLIPPVATLSINVVAGDDVVNASEAMTNQSISGKAGGEFLAGDVVSFTLNGTAYSAAVNASGDWSVVVSGTDLAKGNSIEATLVAHDIAGNSSSVPASHPYTVDLIPPVATLSIDPVTADNILNLEESKVSQTISGKAGGEFLAGDVVSFTLNGHAYSAAVNASGDWNVSVSGADLAKETNIHATLLAHDSVGNSSTVTADHGYTVDLVSTTPVITSVYDAVGDKQGNLVL
ncbi:MULTISPECIES: Ig-like domain-containing protein, partial [unclassified Pseudomonas]